MKKIMFYVILYMCKLMNFLIAKIIRRGGSTITGKLASILQKDFVTYFTNINLNNVIMVTGTNGKTSTANLLAYTIEKSGRKVATNSEGANMIGGVATTLIKNSNLKGRFNKDYLVLEIDERSIESLHKKLPAKNLVITNILKDQVQRNGDPDFIYQKIKNVINEEMTLYLNNEEPRSKGLEEQTKKVIYYSVEKHEESFEKNRFNTVTLPCPKCSNKIVYNYYNIENVGNFQCSVCEYKSEYDPTYCVTNVNSKDKTIECQGEVYNVNYTLPFYLYNYSSCIAVCKNLGIEPAKINEGFSTFKNPFERREIIKYKDKEIKYLRMKQENPETLQNAINTVIQDKTNKAILIGLFEIKDFKPAYANTFYFFDCEFEEVAEGQVEKYISFSKTVSYDTANRMIYAGVPKEKIEIIDSDDVEEVLKKIDDIKTNNIYILTGMKPYKKIKQFFLNQNSTIERIII